MPCWSWGTLSSITAHSLGSPSPSASQLHPLPAGLFIPSPNERTPMTPLSAAVLLTFTFSSQPSAMFALINKVLTLTFSICCSGSSQWSHNHQRWRFGTHAGGGRSHVTHAAAGARHGQPPRATTALFCCVLSWRSQLLPRLCVVVSMAIRHQTMS